MNEPKTVWGALLAAAKTVCLERRLGAALSAFAHAPGALEVLTAHIIPGTECVAAGLEDAALALSSYMDYSIEAARAVLEAAGIFVPDDVVNVRANSPVTVGFDTPERAVMIMLERGDTIFIKRAATGKEDTSTASTRSADVSKRRGRNRQGGVMRWRKDDIWLRIARRVPRVLAYWVGIVILADVTTGIYADKHPETVRMLDALDKWYRGLN